MVSGVWFIVWSVLWLSFVPIMAWRLFSEPFCWLQSKTFVFFNKLDNWLPVFLTVVGWLPLFVCKVNMQSLCALACWFVKLRG